MLPAFMSPPNFPENPKYGHQRFACIQAPNGQEALGRLYASAKRGARLTYFDAHPMQPHSHHIARGLNRRRPTSNLFWQNYRLVERTIREGRSGLLVGGPWEPVGIR